MSASVYLDAIYILYYISISIKIYKANKHLNKCLNAVICMKKFMKSCFVLCVCIWGVGASCHMGKL